MSIPYDHLQSELMRSGLSTFGAELLVETDRRDDTWPVPSDIELTDVAPSLPPIPQLPADPAFLAHSRRSPFKHMEPPADRTLVEGPWITWTVAKDAEGQQSPRADGCLDQFWALAEASPERVLAFARRWGPMGICRCAQTATHSDFCGPVGAPEVSHRGEGRPGGDQQRWRYWEPVAVWRHYVRVVRAVLGVAATLEEGGALAIDDVDVLIGHVDRVSSIGLSNHGAELHKPHVVRWIVAMVIDDWFRSANIRVSFIDQPRQKRWSAPLLVGARYDFRTGIRFGELFGSLGLQLATALTSPSGLFRCDNPECRRPYTPGEGQRRPKRGPSKPRHFCPECRVDDLVAKRLSARDRRAKRRANQV
jgi:hypothetical protein